MMQGENSSFHTWPLFHQADRIFASTDKGQAGIRTAAGYPRCFKRLRAKRT